MLLLQAIASTYFLVEGARAYNLSPQTPVRQGRGRREYLKVYKLKNIRNTNIQMIEYTKRQIDKYTKSNFTLASEPARCFVIICWGQIHYEILTNTFLQFGQMHLAIQTPPPAMWSPAKEGTTFEKFPEATVSTFAFPLF